MGKVALYDVYLNRKCNKLKAKKKKKCNLEIPQAPPPRHVDTIFLVEWSMCRMSVVLSRKSPIPNNMFLLQTHFIMSVECLKTCFCEIKDMSFSIEI